MRSANLRKALILVSILLVLFLLSTGYGPVRTASQQLDMLLESGPDCIAPCWRGLMPGISTIGDLQALAGASLPRSFAGFRDIRLYDGDLQYIWEDEQMPAIMEAETAGTTVSYIGFYPLHEAITLGSVLEELGPPQMYTAMLSTFERPFLTFWLFYEERGIVVNVTKWSYDISGYTSRIICEVPLNNELPAREIFLLEPAPATEMNETLSRLSPRNLEPLPWRGGETIRMTRCETDSD